MLEGLSESLEVWSSLLVELKHHSEARYVSAMLKEVEFGLMTGTTVPYEPHLPSMHSVQEGAMPVSRTTPRKARVLQGGANLCLV